MKNHQTHPFNGWIAVDKPVGDSSGDVVYKLRKILNMRKIGHGGTLDPFATGILPIALGEATKTVDYLHQSRKSYILTVRFGIATDSDDCTGNIINQSDMRPSLAEIDAVLPNFIGKIQQTPPAFSAIKIDGKRAYKLARAGAPPIMKSREVEIDAINLHGQNQAGDVMLHVTCGKGTYMRSLARDIATKLETYAHLHALRRTEYGRFTEKNIFSLQKIEKMMQSDGIHAILQPIHKTLDGILVVYVNQEQALRLQSGNNIQADAFHIEQDKLYMAVAQKPHNVDANINSETEKPIAIVRLQDGMLAPKRVFNM